MALQMTTVHVLSAPVDMRAYMPEMSVIRGGNTGSTDGSISVGGRC